MADNITYIPQRLKSAAKNGFVTGAIDIIDDEKLKDQQTINQETDEHFDVHNAEIANRYTKEEVNNIVSRTPETDVIVIEIPAASQSDIAGWLDANTPSGIDPETGRSVRANKLYRVPGPDNTTFSEWAWDGTKYIMLANKDYGIDNEPTAESDNLVKSGGVYRNEVSFNLDSGLESKVGYPFVQGMIDLNGNVVASSVSIASKKFYIDGSYLLTTSLDYCFYVLYKAEGASSYTEVASRVRSYKLTGKGIAAVFVRTFPDFVDITPSVNSGFTIMPESGKLFSTGLPEINKSYSYSLKSGYVIENGGIMSNIQRLTTGMLRIFSKKIYVSINKGYNLQIITGSWKNLNNNLGWVLYGGGYYILETNDDYIGINISAAFTNRDMETSEDVGLVIRDYQLDRGEELINKVANTQKVYDLNEKNDIAAFFPFLQGGRLNTSYKSPNFVEDTITSQVVDVNGKYVISCGINYKMYIFYKQSGDIYTEIASEVRFYNFEGTGKIFVNMRRFTSGDPLPPTEDTGFNIRYVDDRVDSYYYRAIGNGNSVRYNTGIVIKKGTSYNISLKGSDTPFSNGSLMLYRIGHEQSIERINMLDFSSDTSVNIYNLENDSELYIVGTILNGCYVDITVKPLTNANFILEESLPSLQSEDSFRRAVLTEKLTDGDMLSDTQYKTVITNGYDVQTSSGRICVAYIGTLGYGEGSTANGWDLRLVIADLADAGRSKEDIPCIIMDPVTHNCVIDGETFTWIQTPVAVWTGENKVTVIAECTTDQRYGLRAREYNLETRQWSEVYICDVSVPGGSVIQMTSDAARTDWTSTNAFWNATGVEHPLGRNGAAITWCVAGSPIKIGDYYYMSMVTGNYAHPLLRTQDMIHFEFVSDIPNSDGLNGHVWSPSEEVSIAYYNNRIYALTRGNYTTFIPEAKPSPDAVGWNTILYCDFDNLSSENWSEPVVMEQYSFERTSICAMDGLIFTLQGTGPQNTPSIDGVLVSRQRKGLVIYDTNLNIVSSKVLTFKTPCLHPIWMKYGGNILNVNMTDYREFVYYAGGDSRSEIRVNTINPLLLQLL